MGVLRQPGARRLAGAVLKEAKRASTIDDLCVTVRVEQAEALRGFVQENLESLEENVA